MEIDKYVADGYTVSTQGGVYSSRKEHTICRNAVVPTALMRNLDNGFEKVELSYFKQNRWRKVVVARSLTASKTSIIKLADNGIEVNSDNAGEMVRYIAACIGQHMDDLPYLDSKTTMGWVEEDDGKTTFMPYNASITFDGDEQCGYLYRAIRKRGSLEEWCKGVLPLRKNLALRLTMAASFASPLIEVVGENPFVFHLWGGTGTGKSVALLVAMSIWGDPAFGKLTRTMNMTANSMLATASFLNNLPFAGDELQTIKSRWGNYDNLIMQITEGVDRGRMTYDRLNETRSWRCSFIFTGEEPCIKTASGGGAKNRVIEVECEGKVVAEGNKTATFVKQHYGTAGEWFIENLDKSFVRELYEEYFEEVLATGTTDKQAGAAALLLTADSIASQLLWGDAEQDIRVSDIAKYLCSADEVDVTERAYQWITDTIAENSGNFEAGSRVCWGCFEGGYAYINRSVLDRLLTENGFDMGAALNKWELKKYIVRYDSKHLRHMKRINGVSTSCIKLLLPVDEDTQIELGE